MVRLNELTETFRQIASSWHEATLIDKEFCLAQLKALEIANTQFRGNEATKLFHDIRYLHGQIEEKIIPAQRRRTIDQLRADRLVSDGR